MSKTKLFLINFLLICQLLDAGDTTRILIGSPVHQKTTILKEFLLSLKKLESDNLSVDYYFIDDNESPESSKLLLEFSKKYPQNTIYEKIAIRHHYECTETTHYWNDELVWKVAGFRNKIILKAKQDNYDYLFLLDSDLVLHPKTLKRLITSQKDIISNIFWTKWFPEGNPAPQVVKYNQSNEESKIFTNNLKIPGIYQVDFLGACTLISKNAITAGVNYDRLEGITDPGEDVHFCRRAINAGFLLYVDTHYPAFHIYRESELSGVFKFKENCKEKN